MLVVTSLLSAGAGILIVAFASALAWGIGFGQNRLGESCVHDLSRQPEGFSEGGVSWRLSWWPLGVDCDYFLGDGSVVTASAGWESTGVACVGLVLVLAAAVLALIARRCPRTS